MRCEWTGRGGKGRRLERREESLKERNVLLLPEETFSGGEGGQATRFSEVKKPSLCPFPESGEGSEGPGCRLSVTSSSIPVESGVGTRRSPLSGRDGEGQGPQSRQRGSPGRPGGSGRGRSVSSPSRLSLPGTHHSPLLGSVLPTPLSTDVFPCGVTVQMV